MKTLSIDATHNSPAIILNAENLEFKISGDSHPENSQKLFEPIIKWFEEFLDFAKNQLLVTESKLIIALDYFNSSTAKCLFDVIAKYSELSLHGYQTKVYWHYEFDDDDVLEAGKDLAEMLNIEFDFVPIYK